MTKEELVLFGELYKKYMRDCKRVCNILQLSDRDYLFLDTFTLNDDVVEGTGEENWNYGGHEEYYKVFDAEYLTKTNEELQKIVLEWNEQKEREKKLKLEVEKKTREMEERKLLEELKAKYSDK